MTLNLFEGDFQALQNAYPEIGAGKIVREMISAHLRKISNGEERFVKEATEVLKSTEIFDVQEILEVKEPANG